MSLLGPWSGGVGARLFNRLITIPGLYDGLHFAHLRTGSRLADLMDRAASAKLVPAPCAPNWNGSRQTLCSVCSLPVLQRRPSSRPRCQACAPWCCAPT